MEIPLKMCVWQHTQLNELVEILKWHIFDWDKAGEWWQYKISMALKMEELRSIEMYEERLPLHIHIIRLFTWRRQNFEY